ncbi:energy transducer TonB [Algoriphagus sp. A40]|uniref:energy transducer TonB n=1 Tax=Algoriphagus sp. A40 TaxID=1945863 RepID=UPI000985B402|nr:energy transducer TonB [Algoriphagus sp. A40]
MKLIKLKNKALSLLVVTGMVLTVTSCQMEQVAELEGPTQVEAMQSLGPTSILALVDDVGKDGKEIFDVTEVQPNPPGGMQGWSEYLSTNLTYPAQARQMGIEGTVIVVFLINSDGSISNVEVLKGIGGGADEEAVRVVENSPKWTPAMQKDRVVNSRMRLPVRFKLS